MPARCGVALWLVEANNPTGAEKTLTMWVLCLDR